MTSASVPYGSWPSPISPELVTAAAVSIGELAAGGGDLWWSELRPEEGGRTQIVRCDPAGSRRDVLPEGFAARTRVHEYGGGAWWLHGGVLFFCNWDDQRVYRLDPDADPVALTPEPIVRHGDRYADGCLTPDGRWVIAVNEHHEGASEGARHEPLNRLVVFDAERQSETLVVAEGSDFYANPRVSPDGNWLAWLEWQHPDMPWDSTELFVAPLVVDSDGIRVDHAARRRLAGPGEWLFQPEWAPDGSLWFASDRTGWSSLYRVDADVIAGAVAGNAAEAVELVAEVDGDIATPQWVFGLRRFCFLADGRVLFAHTADGRDVLAIVDPAEGQVLRLDAPWTACSGLIAVGESAALVAASFTEEPGVYLLDVGAPHRLGWTQLRSPRETGLGADWFAVPEHIAFPTGSGETAFGFYYPPTNPEVTAPADDKPPLLVTIHGGPTSSARAMLQLGIQYWTSRGIAVLDVNYRGSTGYGRSFRRALDGRWGVADVEDCVAGAHWLAERGLVDRDRLAIRGGSAGGFTTLCALIFHDAFSAGASLYGVTDLEALARDTHKFESRYLDRLVGPYPQRRDLYVERSPIHHVDRLRTPVIIFQGLEDEVVPPAQAEVLVSALRTNGVPFAYVVFEGEQHGFRKAENIRRVLEAELSFYGQVFGFDTTGIQPIPIENP